MNELTDIPNIGKELSKRLCEIDIRTIEDLKSVGTEQIFIRLRAIDPGACIHMLYAIEGAVQGVRWHHLTADRKSELKEYFKLLNKSTLY